MEVRQIQILKFYLTFFLFMIFQILIYGLFISEIKDQNFLLDFFFSQSLSWVLKNKGVRFMVRVCKFVIVRGFKIIFKKISYIYIYINFK